MTNKYIDVVQVSFSYENYESQLLDQQTVKSSDVETRVENSFESLGLVLKNVSLSINKGQHIALLGRNGSGKSTLARLLNALELPSSGTILIDGEMATDLISALKIRQKCGLVFQNPDNQLIGTTVEEEIAFGPENLGIDPNIIKKRVLRCSEMVGLSDYLSKSPASLSGGQKQKLAIAGILAMEPIVILLDESTSMLDPQSRKEFLTLCEDLRQKYQLIFVNITHDMEEVMLADYVYVLDRGEVVLEDTPSKLFDSAELLQNMGLDIPFAVQLQRRFFHFFQKLENKIKEQKEVLSSLLMSDKSKPNYINHLKEELAIWQFFLEKVEEENNTYKKEKLSEENIKKFFDNVFQAWNNTKEKLSKLPIKYNNNVDEYEVFWAFVGELFYELQTLNFNKETIFFEDKTSILASLSSLLEKEYQENSLLKADVLLKVDNISYEYPTMGEHAGFNLNNISFELKQGEILGIMGATGSGKSTLMQHLNGLLLPNSGNVFIHKITDKNGIKKSCEEKDGAKNTFLNTRDKLARKQIRRQVGLLFQYPEHQLFAQTVDEDICFGPRQLGRSEEEITSLKNEIFQLLELDLNLLSKSPFELSGGQKRKIALAGVLMCKPDILILDEPAAGLDPLGKKQVLELVQKLRNKGLSIIMVSHSMEDLVQVADNLLVLKNGKKIIYGSTAEVFIQENYLKELRLDLPQSLKWTHILHKVGYFSTYFEKMGVLPALKVEDILKRLYHSFYSDLIEIRENKIRNYVEVK